MLDQIAKGFIIPFQGLKFIFQNKKLLAYVGLPILINLIIYGIGIYFFVRFAGTSLDFLSMEIWYEKFFYYLIIGVGIVLILFLAIFTFIALTNILGSPFYELLSRKASKILKTDEAEEKHTVKENILIIWESLAGGVKRVLIFLASQIMLLFISLLPLIGATVITIINIMITGWFLAMEFLDFEFERREWTFDHKLQAWKKNRWSLLGFGLGALVGSMIPVFNLIFLPACVVGASLYYKEFLHKK